MTCCVPLPSWLQEYARPFQREEQAGLGAVLENSSTDQLLFITYDEFQSLSTSL